LRSPSVTWISADDPPEAFPDVNRAFDVPDGLLAAGGDLSEPRLLYAYSHGIFPWYSDGQPILWWSPDPRCVIRPPGLHISRRTRRSLMNGGFAVTFNAAFDDVLENCALDRPGQDGTWITDEMRLAYQDLHRSGWAHSVEIWHGNELAGGLYGLSIGRVFFGESMFTAMSNGSKAAMLALCRILEQEDFELLDCQVESPHLLSLGAELMPRTAFSATLASGCNPAGKFANWPAQRVKMAEFLSR
jgi:leucyl/phenylalanyl-tRNA--protein transferase